MTLHPHHADESVTLYAGDCIEVMRELPDCSVDAVVTDPPYGLEFMGKEWDSFKTGRAAAYSAGGSLTHTDFKNMGTLPSYTNRPAKRCAKCGKQAWSGSPCKCPEPEWVMDNSPLLSFQSWCAEWATEALRVLKPGGHLLAFGGTRTWHRLACAIEDAGFEVRDSIAWMYGSGFPKSLDVSKAIDKAAGATREPSGAYTSTQCDYIQRGEACPGHGDESSLSSTVIHSLPTAPATPEAKTWQGWGTALKPAFEPIVVARRPLIGTVAANVLAHGTGAINVDATRIGTDGEPAYSYPNGPKGNHDNGTLTLPRREEAVEGNPAGRWPANVILDESQAAELDRQSGVTTSGSGSGSGSGGIWSESTGKPAGPQHGDTGGASRFFYTAKADSSERPRVRASGSTGRVAGTPARTGRECNVCGNRTVPPGGSPWPACGHEDWSAFATEDKSGDYIAHPTVKPLTLMRYLVRLVTPPAASSWSRSRAPAPPSRRASSRASDASASSASPTTCPSSCSASPSRSR